mmetsp:Transcript_20513/g.25921  ORF Transcript_20513/g.25921 Transcript_20513/m.25921 type:complete len:95 (+) Transcript_20513:128-412(+)
MEVEHFRHVIEYFHSVLAQRKVEARWKVSKLMCLNNNDITVSTSGYRKTSPPASMMKIFLHLFKYFKFFSISGRCFSLTLEELLIHTREETDQF